MIRKVLGGVVAGIAVLVVALGAVVMLLSNHSYVTTPSMYPTIPPGSEIFVSHEKAYHVGQVIEFHANGLTWAHRIIKINSNGTYVTKGDNPQNAPDVFVPALTQQDIVGAVTHAPRWIGFPELIIKHPGYGLSWLRAELGVGGRIGLVGTFGLGALLYAGATGRKRGPDAPPEPSTDEVAADATVASRADTEVVWRGRSAGTTPTPLSVR
jgi:signal peptidase I